MRTSFHSFCCAWAIPAPATSAAIGKGCDTNRSSRLTPPSYRLKRIDQRLFRRLAVLDTAPPRSATPRSAHSGPKSATSRSKAGAFLMNRGNLLPVRAPGGMPRAHGAPAGAGGVTGQESVAYFRKAGRSAASKIRRGNHEVTSLQDARGRGTQGQRDGLWRRASGRSLRADRRAGGLRYAADRARGGCHAVRRLAALRQRPRRSALRRRRCAASRATASCSPPRSAGSCTPSSRRPRRIRTSIRRASSAATRTARKFDYSYDGAMRSVEQSLLRTGVEQHRHRC